MRKFLVGLAIAAATLGAAAGPSKAAAASSCSRWTLPSPTLVTQSNGYKFVLTYNGHWAVQGSTAEVKFTDKRPNYLRFIITWPNGAGGVYTGSIDGDGFISGTTVDRWKPTSRATWNFRKTATCQY